MELSESKRGGLGRQDMGTTGINLSVQTTRMMVSTLMEHAPEVFIMNVFASRFFSFLRRLTVTYSSLVIW